MPFIAEQRRPASAFPIAKQWSECAGSKSATVDGAQQGITFWQEYDKEYKLEGWEYRIREVKR